jgi:hypothetical protein
MMGQHARSESLFYYFRLEDQIPENHLLRLIDEHIDFGFVRRQLKDSVSPTAPQALTWSSYARVRTSRGRLRSASCSVPSARAFEKRRLQRALGPSKPGTRDRCTA